LFNISHCCCHSVVALASLHEQLHHHLAIVVHRGNLPDTLWVVGTEGDVDAIGRFSKPAVGDGGCLGGFWVGGQTSGMGRTQR
jgi:hypothetical protein